MALHVHVGDQEVWKEEKHPRGPGGKFAEKEAGESLLVMYNLASKHDYQSMGAAEHGVVTFTKGPSTIHIKVEGENKGQWVSTNPGNLMKTGTSAEGLTDLLAGKKFAKGTAPWQNVYTNPLVPDTPAPSPPQETHSGMASTSATEPHTAFQELTSHAPEPTGDERTALKTYIGSGYGNINDCLRYKENCNDARVPPIEKFLEKAKIPKAMTLWRGVRGEYAKVLASVSAVGNKIVDRGFLSTSTNPGVASNFGSSGFRYAISVPAGAKGAAISQIGNMNAEMEVLFQRGTALRVKSWDAKQRIMHVDLVQDDLEEAPEATTPVAPAAPPAQIEMAHLTKVGGQLGSNLGAQYEDPESGNTYYVKQPATEAQAKNEKLAAKLYALTGAPTLEYVDTDYPNMVATKMVKLDKSNLDQFSEDERKAAQQHLATHAWLANWDAAGIDGTNQAVINGQPASIDLGGALLYRAQGTPKGDAFGTSVPEIDSLRDSSVNPKTAQLFAGMTSKQVRESIGHVTQVPDSAIQETVAKHGPGTVTERQALAHKLIARKQHLATYAQELAEQEAAAIASPTPTVPKPKKIKTPKADDPFKGHHTDALHGVAAKLGYVEKPYPNAGVRRMRLINFLTHHAKKSGGTPQGLIGLYTT